MLTLAAAGSLLAHAVLRHSRPAAGARLTRPPSNLRLTFSEAPELAETTIALLDARGDTVALGPLARPERLTIVAPIAGTLSPGDYTVLWHTAAADGHATHGRFGFTVLAPAGSAPLSPPAGPAAGRVTGPAPPPVAHGVIPASEESAFGVGTPAYVVIRWLLLCALLAAVGAVAFRLFVLGAVRRRPVGAARLLARTAGKIGRAHV